MAFPIAAIIGIGIALLAGGASYVQAKQAQKKAKKLANSMAGVLLNKESNIEPLPVIYGTRRVGGVRVFVETNGSSNEYLYMALALCEGEVGSIAGIEIDGVSQFDSRFAGLVAFQTHTGADDQAASALLIGAPSWTNNHRLRGVAYLSVRLKWDQNAFSGIPEITALVTGKKVYDPRTGNTTWSSNPALCIRDYLTNNRYGKGLPASAIDDNAFSDAADDCDNFTVTPYSGATSTIKLFQCNAVIDTGEEIFRNVEKMLLGCRGFLPYTNGKYALYIDQSKTHTLDLTLDNIIGGITFAGEKKEDKFNRVIVKFPNPSTKWQEDAAIWPDAGSTEESTYLGEDNNVLLVDEVEMETVTNYYSARDFARIFLLRSRNGIRVSLQATSEAINLVVGDVVRLTHPTPSFTNKPFQVEQVTLNYDGTVNLDLLEYDSTIYTYDTAAEETDYPDTDLPDPFTVAAPTALTLTESTRTEGDGTIIPSVLVQWTAADDSFVNSYEVQYKLTTASTYKSLITGATDFDLTLPESGADYDIRVRSINSAGVRSSFVTDQVSIVGDNVAPGTPSNGSTSADVHLLVVTWDNPSDSDFSYTEVKRSNNSTEANATSIAKISGESFTDGPFAVGTTRYYWLRAVDRTGNASAWVAAGSDTTVAVDTADIKDNAVTITKIADTLQSTNYSAGSAGWKLTTDGTFEAGDGTFRGALTATSGSIDSSVTIGGTAASTVVSGAADGATALQIGDIAEIISAGNIPTGQLTFNDSGSKTVSYDGNDISVTGGNDNSWDTQVYSSEHYASPCVLQFETTFSSTYRFMMGLNEDPTTNASYTSIDHAWYLNTSSATIYENGSQTAPDGGSFSYSVGDKFSIVYDGDNVYYYHNDTLKRTVTGVGAKDFYLDSSLYDTPLTINDVRFAPISRIDYGSIGGVTITPGKLYQGAGTFQGSTTGFYLDSAGQFSLKDKFSFDGTELFIDGNVEVSEYVRAGSGTNAAIISGRDVDEFAFWAGAGFQSDGGPSGGNAPFRVTRDGKVIMTNFALYSQAGTKLFDSQDGLLALPQTAVAQASGTLVPQVSEEITDTTTFTVTLSSTQTITADFSYPVGALYYSGTSLSDALNNVSSAFAVTLEYSDDSGSTWNTFGSTQNFSRVTSGTPSSSQFFVDNRELTISIIYGAEPTTIFIASLQSDRGAIDEGMALVGSTSQSLAAGTYLIRMAFSATGGSGTGAPATNKVREVRLTTSGAGFTVSNGVVSDGVGTSATTGWVTSNFQGKDSSGNVVIAGNLTVNGTTTTLNTATLDVEDKNITLNYGAGDTSASANGAGITIQDAVNSSTDATILWDATNDEFDFSHKINVSGTSTFAGIRVNNSSTALSQGSGNSLRIQTNSGYVDVGPKNTSWTHFDTDRGKFYFGQDVHVSGQLYKYDSGTTDTPYWHAGNMGADSGLDADTVDGLEAASLLRSDASDNFSGDFLEFQDNKVLRFGTSADYRIWHDGNGSEHTYFRNYNPGKNTYFQGPDNAGTNHAMIYLRGDTSAPYVQLFYDGGEVMRTVSGGIKVSNTVNAVSGYEVNGTNVITSARAASFATLASGSTVLTDTYTGGTGDFTNISTPQLKIAAEGSTYWRIPHVSGHSTVSGVYNYQTGKDVYWGEPGDTGTYRFRGRDLRIDDGNLIMGAQAALEVASNYLRINQGSYHSNGVWFGSSDVGSSSGTLHFGSNGATNTARVIIDSGTYDGSNVIKLDGADGHVTGRKLEAVNSTTANELMLLHATNDRFADAIFADNGGSIRLRQDYGQFQVYTGGSANSTNASGAANRFEVTASGINIPSGNLQIAGTNVLTSGRAALNLQRVSLDASSGNGYNFWDGNGNYVIYMSAQNNSTYGGRVNGEASSDYNMYFKMQSGTNRGFVFRDNTNNYFSINPGGIYSETFYRDPNITRPYITASGTSGGDDQLLTRWRYANTDSYYLDLNQRVTSSQLRWAFSVHNNGSNWYDRLVFKNGFVGIGGLQDPAYTLDVSGSSRFSSTLLTQNYIDSARGMIGGYSTSSGTGGSWGACIWSIGPSWNGSGVGNSYSIGTYGLHWLRQTHASEISFADEGLYLTRASTTPYAALGRAGAYFATRVASTGNITAYYSDERLKDRTGVIENALAKVRSLEGFTYRENELARELGYDNNKEQVGLSAQQVKAVLPHAVSLAPVDFGDRVDGEIVSKSGEDYLTVDYSRLVPLLVESIKELSTEVERLKKLLEKDNGDD